MQNDDDHDHDDDHLITVVSGFGDVQDGKGGNPHVVPERFSDLFH